VKKLVIVTGYGNIVDENLTLLWLIKVLQQANTGTLATSARTNQCHHFTWLDVK